MSDKNTNSNTVPTIDDLFEGNMTAGGWLKSREEAGVPAFTAQEVEALAEECETKGFVPGTARSMTFIEIWKGRTPVSIRVEVRKRRFVAERFASILADAERWTKETAKGMSDHHGCKVKPLPVTVK
jgi:hypothetical protein